jgi:2'-5' RNA ligase
MNPPSGQGGIRSFIAIELPEEVKGELSQLSRELGKAKYPFVKWVDTENIHLTLKFLGNIPPGQVAKITEAVKEAVRGKSPFQLEISKLGAFPGVNQPRVIWIGVGGETDRLLELQRDIDSRLVPLGFVPEKQPFVPHLTIARVRENASTDDRKALGRLLASTGFDSQERIAVDSIKLMRSQLTPEGPVYSLLSAVALAK